MKWDQTGHQVPDVAAHDEALIENWNRVVKPGDTVWHLGDFGFGKYEAMLKIFKRLNGNKHFVCGNHDQVGYELPWATKHDMKELRIQGTIYQLCHFPMRSWNKSYHGARSLFGHVHGTLSPHCWSCDVGTDCWDFTPVSFDQLEELFKVLPRFEQGVVMPKGVIWNAKRHMQYGFKDFFIGDGSADTIDPDELFKKENPE